MNVLPKIKPSKEFVNFCNSLRCPLCDSQLDGNIHPAKATLYCCLDNDEYSITYLPNAPEPEGESWLFRYSEYEYHFFNTKIAPGKYEVSIIRYNADFSYIYKNFSRKVLLSFTGSRLNLFKKNMTEQYFLKKLNTYITFS